MKRTSWILAILLPLLSACIPTPQPCNNLPCPESSPTPRPSPPEPIPTASPTAQPTVVPPVQVQQLTRGKAVFELDLTGFIPAADLDSYAFATLAWLPPGSGPDRYPSTPAFQLGLRGTDPRPCLAKPCAGRVALEVRFSSNIAHDRTLADESLMCGAGTRPAQWLPLGPGPKIRVTAEWGPGFFRASTPVASWQTSQGADGPGFGWWVPGIPPKGLGWSYEDAWTLQAHGGSARLLSWEPTGSDPQPPLGSCP